MRSSVLVVMMAGVAFAAGPPLVPRITPHRETAFVLGPLRRDGYIDYVAAANARLGKPPRPADNAAVLLWRASGPGSAPDAYFAALGMKRPPEKGDYLIDLHDHAARREKIETDEEIAKFDAEQTRAMRRVWSPKELPRIAAWLKDNEKPLGLVIEASERKRYFAPLIQMARKDDRHKDLRSADLTTPPIHEAAAMLVARALLRAGEGKGGQGWADLLASLRLGRLLARQGVFEPYRDAGITLLACEAMPAFLHRVRPDKERLARMMADLQGLPPPPDLPDKADFGRLLLLDVVQTIHRRGLCHLEELLNQEPSPFSWLSWMGPGGMDGEVAMRAINETHGRIAAALRGPTPRQREAALDAIRQDVVEASHRFLEADGWRDMLFGGPALRGRRVAELVLRLECNLMQRQQAGADRAAQTFDNVLIALALEMHHRDHEAYPKNLSALAPKYLAKVPEDRFSGKPLVYRAEGEGYLLYSVGTNGEDDAGRTERDDPQGDDIAVRMPPAKE